MRFHRLDLNLLVALDALLTERSVTKAGERLYLSQSAMSGALAKLREHFEDELIVQVGRKMVLTPLAESLQRRVRDVLKMAQSLLGSRPTFDPRTSERRFSIVSSDVVMSVLMDCVVRRLAAECAERGVGTPGAGRSPFAG
jgi:DNA-binding transcriptional LysR family regulator